MIEWVHPGLIFFAGAMVLPWVWRWTRPEGWVRGGAVVLVPVLAGLAVWGMGPGVYGRVEFAGMELVGGRVDGLSRLFCVIFVVMGLVGTVYGLHGKRWGSHAAAFLYVGGSLGAVLAGDLFTVFVFSEVMAFSSVFLIWFQGESRSLAAGFRYLLMHIVGGVSLLGGVVIRMVETGSLAFEPMGLEGVGSVFILLGFLVNAAAPPLHTWVADAYPEATVAGAVFLSAFTTKTAVYLLIRGFAGTEVLVGLGAVMAVYGVVYATMENDMRRLLSYHIISQVGYMVCGVGIGTPLGINGAAAHALANILYKGALFMGAGAVIQMTGRRKLTELGGLYKTMPWTLVLYMIAGLSISGFPLFIGFVSKGMVVASAAESHRAGVWGVLMLASSGTFLSTTLKLPYAAFFGRDAGLRASDPPWNMRVAMGVMAFLCILIGVVPGLLYGLLPYPVAYAPYTGAHVMEAVQILLFTALGFGLFIKKMAPEAKIHLDLDWFYRKGGRAFQWLADHPVAAADARLSEAYQPAVLSPADRLARWLLRAVEGPVIDGAVNGLAGTIYGWAARIRRIQSGQLQHYALVMVIGLFVILSLYLML